METPYPILKLTLTAGFDLYVQKKLLCIISHGEMAVILMRFRYWVFDIAFPKC